MNRYIYLLFIILVGFAASDVHNETVVLKWEENPGTVKNGVLEFFTNAEIIDDLGCLNLPVYTRLYDLERPNQILRFSIENIKYEELDQELESSFIEKIPTEFKLNSHVLSSAGNKKIELQLVPLKQENGKIYRLKSFQLRSVPDVHKTSKKSVEWNTASVLAEGSWVKIRTSGRGIYKIPFSTLNNWGFSNPSLVGVFGSGGRIMSENPGNITYDDLEECSVWTDTNSGEDCLFFYAPGRVEWSQGTNGDFVHTSNEFTNYSYFFVGEVATPKYIEFQEEVTETSTHSTTTFNAYQLFEQDKYNILKDNSGKKWYGDSYANGSSKNYSFSIENVDESTESRLKVVGAARSYQSSKFVVNAGGSQVGKVSFSSVDTDDNHALYADNEQSTIDLDIGSGDLDLTITYSASNSSAKSWLDYIELNYRQKLVAGSSPVFFRDTETVGDGNIVEYTITGADSDTKVLEISDQSNLSEIQGQLNGEQLVFKKTADELKEYVVFKASGSFKTPEFVEDVENQNLHGLSTPEYLIISHKDFLSSANDLANFHTSYDGMSVAVVDVDKVYNEFSSGTASATGIRNFIKMLYDRGNTLKYVLLLGDGSYDNRNINGESNNYIPTYQSANSLEPLNSYVSDDYFVMLDAGETLANGAIDLGIGRIPATKAYEAELVVDKIKRYYEPEALGDWRNVLCFIGDDGDSRTHMRQSELIADSINKNYGEFITEKLYLDAFVEDVTTAGERYPDVNEAINERVKDGVLILNYIGHANEKYLADEHVLEITDINSWSNTNKLPIFVTATCEFSRFDADETSAGEYVLLNESGGGIGLFSTTRVVYSGANFKLSKSFYRYIFAKNASGEHYRLGDVMRLAKNNLTNGTNKRNFSLLADPALRLSYPKYRVVTNSINQLDATEAADTIGTLEKITIEGYIADYFGNKIDDFTGEIVPTVYDKEVDMETLGNGTDNSPMTFQVQQNIIYSGRASVNNGNFSFSFVVPKDISYKVGTGKIVYYAENGEEDAHGVFDNFCIGGEGSSISDNDGPDIQLYMDSEEFQSGDKTSKNPTLLASLSDENGINTVGTGIGHDITAIIDDDYSNIYVLNNYYQAEKDDYTQGTLEFPLSDLSIGKHTLRLKAWDVANNSSEVEIEFEVSGDFIVEEVSNYPNPIGNYTYFVVEHNQADATLSAIFEIYDINGRLIDQFESDLSSSGNTSTPIRWDITDAKVALTQGIYVYNVILKNEEGLVTSKAGKMLVAH